MEEFQVKSRTIVYDLGKIFHENKGRIEHFYHVVGYCDRDVSRIPKEKGITREYLLMHPECYDIVLITAVPALILPDLMEYLGIPIGRIRVLLYDDVDRLPSCEMKFYGSLHEDAAIMLLVSMLGIAFSDVRYLEIGCNDPVYDNNSFNLYRWGGNGVLVDPLPEIRALVQWMRPRDAFLQVAVSDHSADREQTFYASESDQISSLDAAHHKRFSGEKVHVIHEIAVKVVGINELLAQIDFLPDILLIDAEGEDEVILRGMDYSRYRPKIIMVEVCHGDGSSLEVFMKNQGYYVFMRIGGSNTLFVLKEAMEQIQRR